MAELEATLGSGEYERWGRYYAVEPWGAWRDNLHAGIIASTLVKMMGSGRKKPPEARDFLLVPAEKQRGSMIGKSLRFLRTIAVKKT